MMTTRRQLGSPLKSLVMLWLTFANFLDPRSNKCLCGLELGVGWGGCCWGMVSSFKESYSMSDADCVMLVKHLVNSVSLSQAPFVFLPESFKSYLKEDLQAMPRNILQDRAKKEPLWLNQRVPFWVQVDSCVQAIVF